MANSVKLKKVINLLVLFVFFSNYGQVTSFSSPNSYSQTKFSEFNVNESTGRVVENISLLEYSRGELSVPISLNYVGNGVKVVQQSNWTGTNWTLNAGGVITRVVNDYPDEKAGTRGLIMTLQENVAQPVNNIVDQRADLFSFSFPGYSGSFYLDNNMTPRLTNNDVELKIEFVGGLNSSNDNIILITTPTGIKYYFGGVNASERTKSYISKKRKGGLAFGGTSTPIIESVTPIATTAFYLYKIQSLLGDEILFDYYDDGTKDYVPFQKEVLSGVFSNNTQGVPSECISLQMHQNNIEATFHVTIYNSKKLKEIYSTNSNLKVIFDSSALLLPPDSILTTVPQYDDRILNSIHLKDISLNENLRNIKLEYLFPQGNNSHRFFLEKISINNQDLISAPKCQSFKFEYNSPESLPSRFSDDVDFLGYSNGSDNNGFIAYNQNTQFTDSFEGLANRGANFQFSSKGSLTKVYYPTGGYKEYEYENPVAIVKKPISKNLHIYRNNPQYNPITRMNQSFGIGSASIGDNQVILSNYISQTMTVNIEASVYGTGSYHQNQIVVEVLDIGNNSLQTQSMNFVHYQFTYQNTFNFQLYKDHNYTVTIKLVCANSESSSASLDVFAKFTYMGYEEVEAAGIRLKSIKALTSPGAVVDYKRIFYKKVHELNSLIEEDESAVLMIDTTQRTEIKKMCCEVGSFGQNSYDVVSLISDPLSTYFADGDNGVQYKYVTISYGGDFFENGGIEKHFKVQKKENLKRMIDGVEHDIDSISYDGGSIAYIDFGNNNLNNNDSNNGTLLKEYVIENKDLSLYKKSETIYEYEQTIDNEVINYLTSPSNDDCYHEGVYNGTMAIGVYRMYSFSNKLKSVNQKEFINPVAIEGNQQTGINGPEEVKVITTSTNYHYGLLRGLPTKTTSVDSKGNTVINEYKYPIPTDLSALNLSAAELVPYNYMYSNNIIASPIQTELKYKKGSEENLLSKSRSVFSFFNGKLLPLKVQVAKANNPLRSTTEFTLYDNKGNLIEVTQENQLKKSFIYGYNDLILIAEIDNKAYADISQSDIANLKLLSNQVVDENSLNNFRLALDTFRLSMPEANITSYVYDKYKNLRTKIDVRGKSLNYFYDDCKALKMVKDHDNNIIEEFEYNLKNN